MQPAILRRTDSNAIFTDNFKQQKYDKEATHDKMSTLHSLFAIPMQPKRQPDA